MIPVRVLSSTKPILASERRFSNGTAENYPCPVCDLPLGTGIVVLVFVGIEPERRKPGGYTTGAAVAVHAVCAGVDEKGPSPVRTCCPTPTNTSHSGTCPNSLMRSGEERFLVNDYNLDRELVDRVQRFREHIEDMPDDERVFLLGALCGALERHLDV